MSEENSPTDLPGYLARSKELLEVITEHIGEGHSMVVRVKEILDGIAFESDLYHEDLDLFYQVYRYLRNLERYLREGETLKKVCEDILRNGS